MAYENLSDFEFYPDRFLKYKYKEKKYLNCTIVKETWDNNPAQQSMYKIADEFYHRSLNVPNNYIHVKYFDIKEVFENPDNFKDSNFVLLPTEVSLFEGGTYWIPGQVFETTETIILSSVPKQTTLTSLIFLNIETQVMVLLLLALLSVSLTLTLVQIVRKSSKTRTKSSRSFRVVALNCLKHCWNSSSIFYSEPYPFIPRIISARIATLGWLLGVTLFVSVVNCVIKSDFSEERYQYLDDLGTLMEKEEIKPIVIEDGFTHLFLKIASKRNKKIRDYLSKFDEDNFCSVVDLMDLGFYEDILNGKKALIINRLLLTWFLGYQLSEDLPKMRSLRDKYGGLYISKQRVKSDFLAFLVNRTFSIDSPILREQEGLGNLVFFETAVFRYLDLKSVFALHFMEWMKPTKVSSSLNLSGMTGPFIIFMGGHFLATSILIMEAALFIMKLVLKKKPSPKRKLNINLDMF